MSFAFQPAPGNPAFTTYTVGVTPNTHRIFCIQVFSETPLEPPGGHHAFNSVVAFLIHKYSAQSFWPTGHFVIDQGTRKIEVDNNTAGVNGQSPLTRYQLFVKYSDLELSRQADQEAMQNLVDSLLKDADGTGL